MATKYYEYIFSSVLPAIRPEDEIYTDLTSDINKRQIAQIELLIKKGDSAYLGKKYYEALNAFKEARAEIYKILYPSFDVGTYVLKAEDYILPVSAAIERNLMDVSIEILDLITPQVVEAQPVLGHLVDVTIDSTLLPLTQTGYRESIDTDETIPITCEQAIFLMHNNKTETALALMENTLSQAKKAGTKTDHALLAALELNIASAAVQIGENDKAMEFAEASLKDFERSKDIVGQAQALHLAAIAAQETGNSIHAEQLFGRASVTLKRAAGKSFREETTSSDSNSSINSFRQATQINTTKASKDLPGRVQPAVGNPSIDLPSSLLESRIPVGRFVSRNLDVLEPIAEMNAKVLTLRAPGRMDGWVTLPLQDNLQKQQLSKPWQVAVQAGNNLLRFEIGGGKRPSRNDIIAGVYEPRINAMQSSEIQFQINNAAATTFYLTHLYSYTLLVKIGDTYHVLGQYEQAESNYREAAKYSYLNKQIEGSMLWTRLACNAIEWGHALYKEENMSAAKEQYSKLITENQNVPDSFMYSTSSLSVPASDAQTLIQNIQTRPLPNINWEIAVYVMTAQQYLQQILDGLDFYAITLSPIHTFEYLQGIARGFAQEAIQAEREFVNFKSRQEAEESTRRDLESTIAMAKAEADARFQQYLAALEDESAAHNAYLLAIQRRDNAQAQRNQYAAASSAQIWAQAAAAALGGGEDAYWSEISELADRLDRGETISGPGPKLAAAQILRAGRKTRAYELAKMQDTINELNQAINIAKDQWDSTKRRTAAAEIAWQAALQRAQMANAAIEAFDNEFFTPESWGKMADIIRDISRSYLFRAIRIAKLMERAYNFENDTQLKVIKSEYGHGIANPEPGRDIRLLGGDSLLKDIDSFTYHAITTKTRKSSTIKDVISVSADFPAQFEQFRSTGFLELETDLYEFDRLHPGYYGQRIEAVEVEIIGVLPQGGLNGTLTLGGVTRYRKKDGSIAQRVHQVDTMALSEYILRNDSFIYHVETGVRGLFQGFGIGTTWIMHLPKRSNNFDFRRIFDVQLIIYYTAKFDPVLRTSLLQAPPRSDEFALLRTYGMRYDFPDSWYAFYQNGIVQFTLDRFSLPINQKNFAIQSISFRVVPVNGITNQGIELKITAPNGVSNTLITNASGLVSSDDSALVPLIGLDPLGQWQIEALGGEPITKDGQVQLDRIYNIQVGLEYTYEYVEEEIV